MLSYPVLFTNKKPYRAKTFSESLANLPKQTKSGNNLKLD